MNLIYAYKHITQKVHNKEARLFALRKKQPWFFAAHHIVHLALLKLAYLVFSFSVLLFKSAGESFIIFTEQPSQTLCLYSYTDFKTYQYKVRLFSATTATTIIVFTIIGSLVLNLISSSLSPAKAATYTWTQTNWAGGATANNATHASNQTGWTEYSAKDASLSAVNAGADLQVSTQSNTWTVTDNGTTDTGFNNAGAATSSTVVNSTGGGAVVLAKDTPSWVISTVDSNASPQDTSIQAIDENTIYISYYDYNNVDLMFAKSTNGGSTWTSSTIDSAGGTFSSMYAVDANNIFISYSRSNNLMFAKSTNGGSTWTTSIAEQSSGDPRLGNGGTSIYAADANNIFISYNEGYLYYDLKFAKSTNGGSSWTISTLDSAGNTGSISSIYGIGSNLFISYRNSDANLLGFAKSTDSGTTWATTTVASAYAGEFTSLHATDANNIFVVYKDVSNSKIGFAKSTNGGSSWTISNINATNTLSGSLHATDANNIFISYDDDPPDRWDLMFAKSTNGGSSWTISTLDSAGYTGNENSIYALDNNTIFVSFRNGNYKLALAKYSSLYISPGTFTSHIYDTSGTISFGTLSWTATTPSGTSVTIKARSGNQSNLSDATAWASCTNITSGSALSTGVCVTNGHRYIQFQATLSTTDTTQTPTLSDVSIAYTNYPTAVQALTSSMYDAGDSTAVLATVKWNEDTSLPTGTSVQFQLRSATSTAALANMSFLGPDGTTGTKFSNSASGCSKVASGTLVTCTISNATALGDGSNDEFFQYKVFLTASAIATPTLADAAVSYVVNAAPAVSNVTATQGSDGVVSVGYDFSDADNSSATVGLFADIGITLSDNPLSASATTVNVSSGTLLPSSGTILIDSEEITYTGKSSNQLTGATRAANTTRAASHTQSTAVWIKGTTITGNAGASTATGTGKTASWTIATDLPNIENASAKILVYANDLNLANQVGTGQSATLTIDTKVPLLGAVPLIIDASASPASLTFSVSDLTSLQYKAGLSSGAGTFASYATSTAITISATDPSTIYYTFKDAKGNQTTGSQATLETPSGFMIQDVTNVKTASSTPQLFIAWGVIANPSNGFKQYNVYRSTDNQTYSLVTTQTDRAVNYYLDTSSALNTLYYYKVTSQDNNNNISFYSQSISGKANGIQDQGEGGGGQPTITSVTTASKTTQTATITWTTNVLSDSTVEYSTTQGSYTQTQGVPSMVTSHSVTLNGLAPNTAYYYRVKSTDPSGLQGSNDNSGASYTFTTNQGPIISNVTIPNITNATAKITWDTTTASDSYVIFSTSASLVTTTTQGSSSLVSSGPPYSHSVTLSGLTQGTAYYFYAQSTDAQSNIAQDKHIVNGVVQYYTFTTTQDATAPTLSITCSSAATLITDASAIIIWQTTSESSTSQVEYSTVSGTYSSQSTTNINLDTTHSVKLTGLSDLTTYYYRARSKDAQNNETISSECSFQTLEKQIGSSRAGSGGGGGGSTADKTLPTITNISTADITKDTATITWKTNENATSLVKYGTTEAYDEIIGDITSFSFLSLDHSVILKHLTLQTLYHFSVLSQDSSGNLASSKDTTFTTLSNEEEIKQEKKEVSSKKQEESKLLVQLEEAVKKLKEKTGTETDIIKTVNKNLPSPIIIGDVPEVVVTQDNITISWKTDQPANSLVALVPEQQYDAKKPDPYPYEIGNAQELIIDHKVTILNLLPGSLYHFQVRSKGVIGEGAKSKDFTFVTASENIRINLPAIQLLSDTSAVVTWQTSTLADSLVVFTPYNTKTNTPEEEKRQSKGSPSFTQTHQVILEDLQAGSKYKIEIQSRDRFNKLSSEVIPSFTTGKDTLPPDLSQIRIKQALAPGKTPIVQSIISWKTDELSTSKAYWSEGAGHFDIKKAKSTKEDETLTTNHLVVLTQFAPGRVYRFKVSSRDQSQNTALSKDITTLAPQRQQTVIDIIIKNFQDTFGFLKNVGGK